LFLVATEIHATLADRMMALMNARRYLVKCKCLARLGRCMSRTLEPGTLVRRTRASTSELLSSAGTLRGGSHRMNLAIYILEASMFAATFQKSAQRYTSHKVSLRLPYLCPKSVEASNSTLSALILCYSIESLPGAHRLCRHDGGV
jgi:hypothetical protein